MIHPRLLFSTLLAALAALLVAVVATSATAIDFRIYDALVRWAGVTSHSNRVAVVAVDQKSLDAIGSWPWPTNVIQSLFDRVGGLGASVIAVDLPLTTSESSGRGGLLPGSSAGRAAVMLGYAFTFGPDGADNQQCRPRPLSASIAGGEPPLAAMLFHATGSVCPPTDSFGSARMSGFLNIGTDPDGIVRRVPLILSYGDAVYPALALAATQALLEPDQTTLAARRDRPLQLEIDGRPVALGDRGTLGLRFRDSARLAHIPAVDVLGGRVAPGVLDGRLVFLGITAPGSGRFVTTPVDSRYPDVEVHASAAENLLQGDSIAALGYHRLAQVLLAIGLVFLTALLIQTVGVRWGAAGSALALVAVWSLSAVLIGWWNTYLSPLLPTLATAAACLAGVFAHFERQRLRFDLVHRWRAAQGHRRRRQAHEFLVQSLTSLMEIRDPSTGRHSRRTQGYSRLLAQRLAHTTEFHDYLTDDRIELLSLLSPLHDIGKVGIRDAVLNKTSGLTAAEIYEMQQHPVYGYETISKAQRQVGIDSAHDEEILKLAKDIVYTHHERWDGTGYPRGLRGHEIPIAGRIMALVDVYDALVEPRPYRRRLPHDEAVALIVAGRGSQFDPNVVEAFLTVAPEFQELGTRLRESPAHPQP